MTARGKKRAAKGLTVAQLIAKLSKMPPDREVVFPTGEGGLARVRGVSSVGIMSTEAMFLGVKLEPLDE